MANARFREGSTRRRTAILDAAQGLFLSVGFDRTKMDSIAAAAGVSKRTVYDYYGDKQALFTAVVERVMRALDASVLSALHDDLSNVDDLEDSLASFAHRIARSALGSSEYSALARLLALESPSLPDTDAMWTGADPEEALAARFADYDRQGLLIAPDPRRAADHFVALTLAGLVPGTGLKRFAPPGDEEIGELIRDGVRVFLRAYGPNHAATSTPVRDE